ncbi:carbonic anhydrase [Methylobacterium soli]|uniref:carbonic anhydrase n=1 Tax=Methylobacterium soli TaxID=553447 RepID=A0A6L3STE3_9HYPH|nr:carbonic anhydrase [Methylobacterium soli]KAB1071703.1 carbonic anhydrase [Methylobacterium soli]GJE43637.1 Carbonic anhydrase 2 [Methylobacterium soli]
MTLVSLSRRNFVQCACCATIGSLAGLSTRTTPVRAASGHRTDLTPDQALALLKEGNRSFTTDAPFRRETTNRDRRIEIARGQTPFVVLVGCSDSRVSPELLFGRGLGELFIVRNAGNTVDSVGMGSVEYGVAELGVPLIVVLGHEKCGAVQAAVQVVKENATFPGSIGRVVEPIVPAVLKAQSQAGDLLDNSVRENVRRTVHRLRTEEALLVEPQKAGKLKIVGARYDLDDGSVDFFDEG